MLNPVPVHPRPVAVLPATLVTAALIAAVTYVRLIIYPDRIVPLAYALPLLVGLWHRNLWLHWATAVAFTAVLLAKLLLVLPANTLDRSTQLVFGVMQFANILIPAVVIHAVIVLVGRLRAAMARAETINAELEASNEELVAREEEIGQQNEELQNQAEELEQQTEELSAQASELNAVNDQLGARERTLARLLELSLAENEEHDVRAQLGQAVAMLFAPRAAGAAVREPDGGQMRLVPLFGVAGDAAPAPRERTLADVVVVRDRAAFLADTAARPDLVVPALVDGVAVSLLAAPLRAERRGTGAALEIYGREAGDWSEQDLRLAQWVAEQIGRVWATARLRAELERHRGLLRTVTEHSSSALLMLDAQHRCSYANPAALQLTGYTEQELIGADLLVVLEPVAVGAGAIWPAGEHSLRRKNGARFPGLCQAIVVAGGTQQEGTVVEIRDVTEARRVAAEREQLLASERAARSLAEQASRAKDEFVATLSHELRTPLNAILGWATILRRGLADPVEVAKGFEVIERNARHQAQLISDLLDMSTIIAGKVQLDVQPLDLRTVIDGALDAIRPAAEAKGVRVEKRVEAPDRPVMGDSGRLQQVVWNLLTNAVKFTPRDGCVTVQLARVGTHVQLVVSDTGNGIAADVLPYIFQRYRQGEASGGRGHGGLGLGLSIVKHLVELHGGTVHAQSDGPQQGASFTVLLPVRAGDHAAVARLPAAPAGVDEPVPSLAGLPILVVDDDPDARDLVGRVLSDRGAKVTTVGSGEEALAALERTPFRLLVSDIGMPGMDGYALIRKLRTERGRTAAELPAIALTALARSEDRTRALLAGFQSHVSKPVESAELVATVASLRPVAAPEQARG